MSVESRNNDSTHFPRTCLDRVKTLRCTKTGDFPSKTAASELSGKGLVCFLPGAASMPFDTDASSLTIVLHVAKGAAVSDLSFRWNKSADFLGNSRRPIL